MQGRRGDDAGVPPEATVLHADLDAFFASVEQRDHPRLRGRPVAVAGGVVLAASHDARAFGVRSAMSTSEARSRCPGLVVVPPRMDAYSAASRDVFSVFERTTPFVEGLSIDEAFLEVGGLRRVSGTPVEIAAKLRLQVREEVGLAITVGVARTKFLAKVASAVGKPDGLLLVPPDAELEFLHPLPIERLWGVGPKTSRRLRDRGFDTVADVAAVDESTLVSILGAGAGRHLFALARAQDPRRVQPGRRRRSIGAQRALGRRRRSPAELDTVLVGLVDRVTTRLRSAERLGRTVVLRLRFDDFERATRSHTLDEPTCRTDVVLAALRGLLAAAGPLIDERGITLIGIGISNLGDADAVQLELPFGGRSADALDGVVDDVRERFGGAAIGRAVMLGRSPGMAMPVLPD